MLTQTQRKANDKWKKKHPGKQREYQYASYARKFVREIANEKQLKELKAIINERLSQR